MEIKTKRIVSAVLFAVALSFTVRCLPSLIYRPYWIEYIVIVSLTIVATGGALINIREKGWFYFSFIDFLFMFTPWMIVLGTFNLKYFFYVIVTIVCYFLVQLYGSSIKVIKYPYMIFATITSVVTWISFFNPNYYISHILTLFPEGNELAYSFLNKNMYHGFTSHYSRNALYITIAIMLLFSILICKVKSNKIIVYLAFIFFFATDLLVAKRGPSIALIITFFLVVLLKEPSFVKKTINIIKYIAVGVVLLLILYATVPGVRNMANRFVSPSESGDVTSGRLYLWGVALNMFASRPLFGHGWGSFLLEMTGSTFQGVHNDYLQYLAETGVVGFVFFLFRDIGALILTYFVYKKVREKKYDGSNVQYWITFALIFQIFILAYSMTGMPHFAYEQYGLYSILCGYGVGQYKRVVANKRIIMGRKKNDSFLRSWRS